MFAHIVRVEDWETKFDIYDPFVMAYDHKDNLWGVFQGFEDAREVIAWMRHRTAVSMVCLQGEWTFTDDHRIMECDGHELRPGDTWESWSRQCVEDLQELDADLQRWHREEVRESMMLYGIA